MFVGIYVILKCIYIHTHFLMSYGMNNTPTYVFVMFVMPGSSRNTRLGINGRFAAWIGSGWG